MGRTGWKAKPIQIIRGFQRLLQFNYKHWLKLVTYIGKVEICVSSELKLYITNTNIIQPLIFIGLTICKQIRFNWKFWSAFVRGKCRQPVAKRWVFIFKTISLHCTALMRTESRMLPILEYISTDERTDWIMVDEVTLANCAILRGRIFLYPI